MLATARTRRWTSVIAAALALVLAYPTGAQAAVGDIGFVRTISSHVPGAVHIGPVNPLDWAAAATMRANGDTVYVVAGGDGGSGTAMPAISSFRRAADDTLTLTGCMGGLTGCRPTKVGDVVLPGRLYAASSVVSAGSHVYAATPAAVVGFRTTASGDLDTGFCVWDDNCGGVSALPGLAPWATSNHAMAVTADGRDLYMHAAGGSKGAVYHLRRDNATGRLAFHGCVGEAMPGCAPIGRTGVLKSPGDAVLSADGRSLYVVGSDPGSVTHLRRDLATGSLAEVGCISETGTGGCNVPATHGLYRATRAAITPAGDSLYVSGPGGVTHLRRNTVSGDLAHHGCIGYATGCRGDGPRGTYMDVAVAPDGASVYGNAQDAGYAWGAVTHLRRSPNGDLTYAGCVGEGLPAMCRQIGPTGVMNHAGPLLAPGSRVLYSLGVHWRGAITQFARQTS
ncbi:hypothetical protein [Nonomuraea endophytica]|uniref:Uncharacterized protein n=1 Tax=Nonomuraea endophytica TaxID=714136 RepID=A0A7W8EEJ1_9ACTN|nr:hypothetical protein [Nonomuraea endophytica]MBB5077740.1 hypothetical protein [Nonomuraea endophytica]